MIKETLTTENIYLSDEREGVKLCVGMKLSEVSIKKMDDYMVKITFTGTKFNYAANLTVKDLDTGTELVECAMKHLNKIVQHASVNAEEVTKFIFEDDSWFSLHPD